AHGFGGQFIDVIPSLDLVVVRFALDELSSLQTGDLNAIIGALIGLYIVSIAKRRGLSKAVIARMLFNLALDTLLGAVPLVGDVADFAFKANDKNLRLLESRVAATGKMSSAVDWAYFAGAVCAFVGMCGLVVYGFVRLVEWLV
ncbi:MAG TPA: DUF4112 domain-containing protein, partial [Kofleriaceae bacterium]|nr:DUF4112 domain-containing protein [Kofleriaceae bacterium]